MVHVHTSFKYWWSMFFNKFQLTQFGSFHLLCSKYCMWLVECGEGLCEKSLSIIHTHAHTHTCTHSHTLTQHTPAEDAKPINLSAVFVSGTGMVLSWQLPPLASNQTDVQLDSYFINFTRVGSREYMTLTSQTPKIAIGGLDLGQTY